MVKNRKILFLKVWQGLYNYRCLSRKNIISSFRRKHFFAKFLMLKGVKFVYCSYYRYNIRKKLLIFFYLLFVKVNLKEKLNLNYRVNLNLVLENDFHFQWMLRKSKIFLQRNLSLKQNRLGKTNQTFQQQAFLMKQRGVNKHNFYKQNKKRRWL